MVLIAFAFAAGEIVRKCADEAMDAAFVRLRNAWADKRGGRSEVDSGESVLPISDKMPSQDVIEALHDPDRLPTLVELEALSEGEATDVIEAASRVFSASGALRRAGLMAPALKGATALWVDDHGAPAHYFELMTLQALGIEVTSVLDSSSARAALESDDFDLILSDMLREGSEVEGSRFLDELRSAGFQEPMIFYIRDLDPDRDRPRGSVGITNRPAELLHLVLDVLERSRL